MRMIDVLNLMEQGGIKGSTRLSFYIKSERYDYVYDETIETFADVDCLTLDEEHMLSKSFLGLEVKLIPPKPKKYLVKFNMRGLRNGREYLNYDKRGEHVNLNDKCETSSIQTEFTKDESQSIKPVREFLEDMKGKYELIEVEDNANDRCAEQAM